MNDAQLLADVMLRLVDVFVSVISVFFFFKQKTAYEMRISDWSSDVCSSDLPASPGAASGKIVLDADTAEQWAGRGEKVILVREIGRASCRERVCQYV